MPAPDLATLTLTEAAELIQRRQVTPVDLTLACIDRAQRFDPELHAYFTPTFEAAVESASVATSEIAAGNYRGPLHGIPFAFKDLYDTAGIRTTAGSKLREHYVPEEDATAVAKLKAAGIVLLGKLNMHEFALGGTNVNHWYPSPRNPWDRERITGGSSGGSGVAIAAGLALGSLGSDTRGSIRVPASLCGISGLKPTYGRVSLKNVVPLNWSLDHAGPMARSAADCAHILQAIAGYDPGDPTSANVPVPDYAAFLKPDLSGLRIGLPVDYFFDPQFAQPDVLAAVETAAKVLESLGASVSPVAFPDPEDYLDGGAFLAEAATYHEADLRDHLDLYGPLVGRRLNAALEIKAVDYSRARYRQYALKQAMHDLFADVDLLVLPTTPIVAPLFPSDDEGSLALSMVLLRNTGIFNLSGTPVISVPCGFTSEGLPVGLSIAGREWDEALVLQAADAYQQASDWHKRAAPV